MKKGFFKKLLCGVLSFLMFLGAFGLTIAFADNSDEESAGVSKLDTIKELLETISYADYLELGKNRENSPKEFTVDPASALDPNDPKATSKAEIRENVGDRSGKAVYLPEEGRAVFKINVPSTGYYTFDVDYYFDDENVDENVKPTNIERKIYLDGEIPFSEARSIKLTKAWIDDGMDDRDGEFETDISGNDIRPTKSLVTGWRTYTFTDANGLVLEPLHLYLTAGEHTLAFDGIREAVYFGTMRFYAFEQSKPYEEQLKEWRQQGYQEVSINTPIKIQAEKPVEVSDKTIYPLNDRSSPISEPQDTKLVKLNTIGSDRWQNAGQWIKYNVEVEKDGLYEIVLRYKQNTLEGMYSTRRIYINGKVPFEEANRLEFKYSDKWCVSALGNDDGSYLFYLHEGVNEIKLEVALGTMSEVLTKVNTCLSKMNNSYLKIMMITGSSPDSYRDYSFERLIPDEIRDLRVAARDLKEVSELLTEITGQKGSHVATLDKIVVLLERMTSSEDEIAKNLTNLKSYIGTLGTWVLQSRAQPLEIDYFLFQTPGAELPKADAGFFEAFWFEFKAFIYSFFTDYSTLGATIELDSERTVTIWTSTGREKSNILRQLIDREFMKNSEFGVELKLVSGGVLQSTLAGIGPDISSLASQDCMNYAIREAVLPITDMDGFEEITKGVLKYDENGNVIYDENGDPVYKKKPRFTQAALEPLTLKMPNGKVETYALPNTMSFQMMFLRLDILAQLNLEVPKTWDELKQIIPILQNNNMTLGFPSKLAGLKLFLYQKGGEMYVENGIRCNLSSNVALEAFTELTDLFQSYRFPLTYDAANRFRTGEMPIIISEYITLYNHLTVFAPEIEGLWEFHPLPGFYKTDKDGNYVLDENGNKVINNTAVVTVTGLALLRGAMDNKEDAWTFLKWYTSGETQSNYSNELVAIVGQSSKNSTANFEALQRQPWTGPEYKNLMEQFTNTRGITEYPGGYIIARYVDFAFMNVYNKNASAVESLLEYVTDINKEITRKRKEFNFEYIEISNSSQFVEEKN